LQATEDSKRFDAVFTNRIQYTHKIHPELKEWLTANITRWQTDQPTWFEIEKIPDSFLPTDVFEKVGGKGRRRSSVMSVGRLIGMQEGTVYQIHPE